MAETNPFDVFDAPSGSGQANPFDAFDAPKQPLSGTFGMSEGEALSGPIWDSIATGDTPVARTLSAFGQGVKEGFGSEPLTLSQGTTDFLKKAGIFNDYQKGQNSIVRAFNEGIIRPAAVAVNTAVRAGSAAFGGIEAGVAQLGAEVGQPALGQDIAAMVEGGGGLLGSPGALAIPHVPATDLAEARSLNVIGPGGEAAWQGTVEPPPVADFEAEGLRPQIKAVQDQPETIAAPTPEAPPQPQVDIHAAARQIAPDTFREFDTLTAQQETYRQFLADPTRDIDDEIDQLRGQRLEAAPADRPALANQITALENERQKIVDAGNNEPSIVAARDALQQIDYRMRDLAPDVAQAYRQAQSGEGEAVQPEATPGAVEQPAPTAPPAAPPVPQVNIANDVSQKLVAAGRPQEEADAVGAVQQARYTARAANLGTTPDELYASEAPDIRGAETGGRGGLAAGKTSIADDQKIVTLFSRANASTAMHELGHSYLEELIQDAGDDRATDAVRADAQTVRQWLGAEEGADITRRQHEKFARGFERYLMEGVAPSRELGSVFAKFKQWLTAIYQSVAKLRAPITDDIRGVFDRLLSTESQEPVIAPEREGFAEAHERLAETTPPEQASETADRIRAEADQAAQREAPEVYDELTGRTGETGGGTPEGGAVGGNEPAPQPVPAAVGAAGQSPEVGAGGGTLAATRPQRGAGERPAGPNSLFTEPATDLVDTAGNIRLENLNTTADVDELIREMSDVNSGFIGARRGVVGDQAVIDLADAMGLRPEDLNVDELRANYSPEQVWATRQLFVQTANDAHDLAVKAAGGDPGSIASYMQARSRLRMVQEYLSAITAETGRGLRAFRRIEGMTQARDVAQIMGDLTETKTLFQMQEEAKRVSLLDTSGQVAGFLNDADKPGLGAMALEVWTNWLISGPLTHMGYAVGNYTLALHKAIVETGTAAAIDSLKEAIHGPQETRVYWGEVNSQLYAMMKGQRDGFRAAWNSVKEGQTMPLPGESGLTTTPFTKMQAIPNFEVAGVPVPLGSIVRVPGERMVAPIHSYFRAIGYEQGIARLAYRTAMDEGLAGQAFGARVADLTAHPPEEMMAAAREEATQQTLMGKGGPFTQKVSSLINTEVKLPGLGPTKPLKFIDPFVHIQSNIMEQSVISRGPLGLASEKIRADLFGRNGSEAQTNAAARMGAGIALSVVGGGLAMEGLINPSAPSDPKEAAEWRLVNGMPHSFRIGNMSYDLSRLGVLGFQLGIAADLYHGAAAIGRDDAFKVASLLVHSFTQNFLDEGFMRGPSDLIQALDDPDRYGAKFVQNFASSYAVPFSVGMSQVARQIDPYARQARSLLDEVKQKIPWWSETLFPRRSWDGEPIPNRDWLGVYSQHVQNDPVNQAFERLGVFPSQPPRKIRGVALTDKQYDDFSRISGRFAKMQLDRVIALPSFAGMPDGVQRDLIENSFKNARETAAAQIMMTNPGIIATAVAAKKAQLGGAKPPTGGWPQPAATIH
jgi:hypothetical protein